MNGDQFDKDMHERVEGYAADERLQRAMAEALNEMNRARYAYNFHWLGRPIVQLPQDVVTFQELIWQVRPDVIVETGIAHGGSLVFSASMLALLEYCGLIEEGEVIGIDIDVREHNRRAINAHPLRSKMTIMEGSSADVSIIGKVRERVRTKSSVMVFLDSNHEHEHVLAELRAYAPLVTIGSYCVVGDTGIEDINQELIVDRPWHRGNSPKSAVFQYLEEDDRFEIDKRIEAKALISGSPDGFLRRTK